MAVAFSDGYFLGRPCIETRLLVASPLNPLSLIHWRHISLWNVPVKKFSFLLLTRSTLRSNVLAKCHPNCCFSRQRGIQRTSPRPASIHKLTHSPLKLFGIHTSHLSPNTKKGSEVASGHVTLGTNVNIRREKHSKGERSLNFRSVLAMGNFCAVFGCSNRSNREKDRSYYRLPASSDLSWRGYEEKILLPIQENSLRLVFTST